jgi:hypothetical protein
MRLERWDANKTLDLGVIRSDGSNTPTSQQRPPTTDGHVNDSKFTGKQRVNEFD